MSNLAAQNTPYREEKSENEKRAPISPQIDLKSSKKAPTAFRTISEVADDLDVPQHVLRFWETKFSQVKPLKRGGGRRYYRPEDVSLLKHIHHLLYTEGYTIKGVQKLLKGQGRNQIAAQVNAAEAEQIAPAASQPKLQVEGKVTFNAAPKHNLSEKQRGALEGMLEELRALRSLIPLEA